MRLRLALALILAWPMIAAACPALLDVKLPTLTEDAASLCRYHGKVLLVVNTASQCGGVSFPMFSKMSVAKGAVNPFYERLASASKSRPRWNFHKYLVDRKGEKVLAFGSAVTPNDPKFVSAIERLLAQP